MTAKRQGAKSPSFIGNVRHDGRTWRRVRGGFTLIELLVTIAIGGVVAVFASYSTSQWRSNDKVAATARTLANALASARSESMRTGNTFMVFFGTDIQGNSLVDGGGDPVDLRTLDDGRLGGANQNCTTGASEPRLDQKLEDGTSFGITFATTAAPLDVGAWPLTAGSSFTVPGGGLAARWIQFRPEGMPFAVSSTCTAGAVGSGGGAVYVTNGSRDLAVVLSPLGATRVYTWDRGSNQWTNR